MNFFLKLLNHEACEQEANGIITQLKIDAATLREQLQQAASDLDSDSLKIEP